MKKYLLIIAIGLLSFSTHANYSMSFAPCPAAFPVDHPQFCASFKKAAQCHCKNTGLPTIVCQDVKSIFKRMTALFGSLERACQHQKHAAPKDCIENWKCYISGGKDSKGNLCSSTGKACV